MCVVSAVGDFYRNHFPQVFPNEPWLGAVPKKHPSQEEFDMLKAKVDEMMDMLKKARDIDIVTGQPDCQKDEKLVLLRQIAAAVGVRLDAALEGGTNGQNQ